MIRLMCALFFVGVAYAQYPGYGGAQSPQGGYGGAPAAPAYQQPAAAPAAAPYGAAPAQRPVNTVPAPVHYVSIGAQLQGDYKFGYDTGKGNDGQSFREETRLPDGTVQGAYGYIDATGKMRIVKYTAGKEGFKAEGDVGPADTPRGSYPGSAPQPAARPAAAASPYGAAPAQPSYAPQPQSYAPQPQSYAPQPQSYAPRPAAVPTYSSAPAYSAGGQPGAESHGPPVINTELLSYNIGLQQQRG